VISAPIAEARATFTYTAPYARSLVVTSNFYDVAGCGKLQVGHIHLSAKTGIGTWTGKASGGTCTRTIVGLTESSIAYASSDAELAVPVKSLYGHATPTHVAVTWTISAVGSARMTLGGSCRPPTVNPTSGYGASFCFLEASASIFAFAYLVDLTNGSYFYPSNYLNAFQEFNYSSNDTYCYSFTCYSYNYSYSYGAPFAGSTTFTWSINGTLDHSDRYVVLTYVSTQIVAEVQGYPNSTATSSLDMRSPGHGATLNSIVIS
jgi:hypothetical protein